MSDDTTGWFGLTPAEIEEESRNERADAAYREEGMDAPTAPENVGSTDAF